jgi:hypothetical protein
MRADLQSISCKSKPATTKVRDCRGTRAQKRILRRKSTKSNSRGKKTTIDAHSVTAPFHRSQTPRLLAFFYPKRVHKRRDPSDPTSKHNPEGLGFRVSGLGFANPENSLIVLSLLHTRLQQLPSCRQGANDKTSWDPRPHQQTQSLKV